MPRPALPKVPAAGMENAAAFQKCVMLWLAGIVLIPSTTFGR